ncbi:helix-turn-helix domain-containing protein [Endozoicomonas acroporae]|uniref:helix-turn-helix domain-containing protein n=1 Tax=Endozoicomonas acroporae TaxID=1701104 RepID=UPI000C791A08|nr:helix-turn-helix transcriptional regulator [Endozoicomonas acroporae]
MQDDPVINFGKRVRDLRDSRAITQDELAHLAGMDRSYVGQIERGEKNITIRNIHKLANALQVSPKDFFD